MTTQVVDLIGFQMANWEPRAQRLNRIGIASLFPRHHFSRQRGNDVIWESENIKRRRSRRKQNKQKWFNLIETDQNDDLGESVWILLETRWIMTSWDVITKKQQKKFPKKNLIFILFPPRAVCNLRQVKGGRANWMAPTVMTLVYIYLKLHIKLHTRKKDGWMNEWASEWMNERFKDDWFLVSFPCQCNIRLVLFALALAPKQKWIIGKL